MKTRQLKFFPRFNRAVHGHSLRVIRRYMPALGGYYEFQDLFQEAYLVFLRCRTRYQHVDNGAWFMSLYQSALHNSLRKMISSIPRYSTGRDPRDLLETFVSEAGTVEQAVDVLRLPAEVKEMLGVLMSPTSTRRQEKVARRALRSVARLSDGGSN